MLRRPPTSIGLTSDDLALFEKQYAQGQIYADHHESNNTHSNAENNHWGQRQDVGTPDSTRENGVQMAGNAGAVVEGARGQAQAHEGGEDRRVKSREERIQGSVVVAAAAAAAAARNAGSTSAGGAAGRGGGTAQQQR